MMKRNITLILILLILFNIFEGKLSIEKSDKMSNMDVRAGIYVVYATSNGGIFNVTYNQMSTYSFDPEINVTIDFNGMRRWGLYSLKNRTLLAGTLKSWRYFPLWISKYRGENDSLILFNSEFKVVAKNSETITVSNETLTLIYSRFTGSLINGDIILDGKLIHLQFNRTNMKFRIRYFNEIYPDWENLTLTLRQLNYTYHKILRVYSAGKSILGRDVWVCEIPARRREANILLIDGGMHGSEVIGVKAALTIVRRILVDYNNIRELENTTIIVIPMLNPDGVEVSKYLPAQPSRMLRYSRKNARGVDLNRNFNYEWEKGGTSNYDSPTFRGIKPETELEVKTLKQILENRNITFYINLHSGINAILIPAYNVNPYLDLYLSKIARGMSNILGYEVRKGGVYGGSADWALLGKDKATLSIIIELYGDKSKISEDWFLFYNPAEAYQVNEIVDKTYYTILYVLSNLNSWKNELKAENRSTLNIQAIMASIAMLTIFISITLYICKRKIQTGSS